MSSQNSLSAEENFRQAFERLKLGKPIRVGPGSVVSQNNVAREAGLDPSALKKSRFPTLVGEIQLYVTALDDSAAHSEQKLRAEMRAAKKESSDEMKALKAQRDIAQSQLLSAQRAVLELLQENADLKNRIKELSGDVVPLKPSK